MANVNNIKLGPATVTFSGSLGGITHDALDLGAFTDDGVSLTVSSDNIDVPTDQTGTAPAKVFLGGQSATVTTPMLEETFDSLYLGLVGAVSGTGNRIDFGRAAGYDIVDNWSGQLTITPLDSARDKFVVHKAVPTGEVSVTFNSANATVVNLEWRVLPDDTQTDGAKLGYRESQ
jgi:hypothetical protein